MFRITARTVLELGAELISSDIIAFYELIKNGFDAGTKNGVEVRFDIVLPRRVYLRLLSEMDDDDSGDVAEWKEAIKAELLLTSSDRAREGFIEEIEGAADLDDLRKAFHAAQARFNTITVSDTGSGMSLEELERNFLVIGTASRKKDVEAAIARGDDKPPYLGEKGIGRLSAMRLGERLCVETARSVDPNLNLLEIDWRKFADVDAMLEQVIVEPVEGPAKSAPNWSGTSIIISDLSENWTERRVRDMVQYEFARITDPFANASTRLRIAILWNNERLAIPIMPSALLDAAHARVSGDYKVEDGTPSLTCTFEALDLGFPHPREKLVLTFDKNDLRAMLIGPDGNIDESALTTVGPFSFEAHWYNRRRLTKIETIGDQRTVRELHTHWSGILLFRDRFRVFPYGENQDDWLGLDRKALRSSGYTLNKTQFIGRVLISRTANPNLIDQTNREGLRETSEQLVLREALRFAIQDQLRRFMNDVERQYKDQKIDLSDAQERVKNLEERARSAIRRLKSTTPPEGEEAVEELQQALLEYSEFAKLARLRLEQAESESRQMVDLAGVGLMVEVVAHELARSSENALKAMTALNKSKELPEQLRASLSVLQTELKSVNKRIRVLDPLSVSGRQRTEIFSLKGLIEETIEAHHAQFERLNIRPIADLPERDVQVRAVKGMVAQILENLISNSVYWLEQRATSGEASFHAEIRISLDRGPPTITFEDNGFGIAPENRDRIFNMFFSLKDTHRRRGLGLYIAREAAEHNGGSLTLDDEIDPNTGRHHRFVLELAAESEQ